MAPAQRLNTVKCDMFNKSKRIVRNPNSNIMKYRCSAPIPYRNLCSLLGQYHRWYNNGPVPFNLSQDHTYNYSVTMDLSSCHCI